MKFDLVAQCNTQLNNRAVNYSSQTTKCVVHRHNNMLLRNKYHGK
jgi:hypothetical protein